MWTSEIDVKFQNVLLWAFWGGDLRMASTLSVGNGSIQAEPIRHRMVSCDLCGGEGHIAEDVCPDCNGKGQWEEKS